MTYELEPTPIDTISVAKRRLMEHMVRTEQAQRTAARWHRRMFWAVVALCTLVAAVAVGVWVR